MIKAGDSIIVRGQPMLVLKVHQPSIIGTVDVEALDGKCYRVSGLNMHANMDRIPRTIAHQKTPVKWPMKVAPSPGPRKRFVVHDGLSIGGRAVGRCTPHSRGDRWTVLDPDAVTTCKRCLKLQRVP